MHQLQSEFSKINGQPLFTFFLLFPFEADAFDAFEVVAFDVVAFEVDAFEVLVFEVLAFEVAAFEVDALVSLFAGFLVVAFFGLSGDCSSSESDFS